MTTLHTYRKPSPFAVVMFLKNSVEGKTLMREVETVRKKWG
jgi:hypothetical protein